MLEILCIFEICFIVYLMSYCHTSTFHGLSLDSCKEPAIVAVAVCVDPIIELVLLTNGPSPNFDNCYHLIESVIRPRPGRGRAAPRRHSIISASFSLRPKHCLIVQVR